MKTAFFTAKSFVMMAVFIFTGVSYGRNYELKFLKDEASSSTEGGYYNRRKETSKKKIYKLIVGGNNKIESRDEIEIRAATLFKHKKSKKVLVNDIVKYSFVPDAARREFTIATGVASGTQDKSKSTWYDYDYTEGYDNFGLIVELWQGGKCIKHLTKATGSAAKTELNDKVKCAYINEEGYKSFRSSFENATAITEDETPRKPFDEEGA